MAFFIGLTSIFALLWGIGFGFGIHLLQEPHFNARLAATGMFVFIGIMHFVKTRSLTYMIDNFLPFAKQLIYLTGVLEIIMAVGLLFHKTQQLSAWGLIGLLVLMFPANINVAINRLPPPGGLPAKPWYIWSRLAFQPLYIAWLWWAAM